MQPFSGNQRPDLLTALMNMSLVLRLPRKMHLCRSSSNVPRLLSFFGNATKPSRLRTFDKVRNPLRLPRETTSEPPKVVRTPGAFNILTSLLPKVVRTCGAFNILTSKCASRYNGVHFFDIATSKSVRTWCALCILTSKCASCHNGVHFSDIATSKSAPNVTCFLAFSLANVLRATMACTFSTSQLPKVVRTWCILYILTWKCASRHNGVHFFDISISRSGPSMWCFVHFDLEMFFAPQRCAIFHLLSGHMAPHPPL